jgi:excisionase family DNA binding protein
MNEQMFGFDINMPLLRANEVARFLNVSRALAYRLMQTGEIPVVRVNRSVRVRRVDLESYIEHNLIPGSLGQK